MNTTEINVNVTAKDIAASKATGKGTCDSCPIKFAIKRTKLKSWLVGQNFLWSNHWQKVLIPLPFKAARISKKAQVRNWGSIRPTSFVLRVPNSVLKS